MFKQTTFFSILILMAVMGTYLFLTLHISTHDLNHFKKLQTAGKAIAETSHSRSTKQHRGGVQKDLWITQPDGNRLHHRIESASSVLTLTSVEDHLDIVEHLNQIHCSLQDRIAEQNGAPFQQIRAFDAASGMYRYSTASFSAQTVALSLFRLPGTTLPLSLSQSTPYLKGVAEDVSFAASGAFQAKQFKATFVGKEKQP